MLGADICAAADAVERAPLEEPVDASLSSSDSLAPGAPAFAVNERFEDFDFFDVESESSSLSFEALNVELFDEVADDRKFRVCEGLD